ncbi:hypothetical protein MKX03_005029 [Papaver bracteatum]|nr:hypothetical protein MKX03_005029 [Papaver bracteatum]
MDFVVFYCLIMSLWVLNEAAAVVPITGTNTSIVAGCQQKCGNLTIPYPFASIKGRISGSYTTGCFSVCDSIDDVVNGSCVGIGCFQTSIPKGLQRYDVEVEGINQQRRNLKFNPCSYAFLAEEIPLLVYEFVANGTLFYHLHKHDDDGNRVSSLSWEKRLRIALEVASSLAYLHSAASIPIIHRDIKSSNILLDHNYTAKVADFGASTFIPIDKTELTTMVQGTLGYLDPEYFHTSQLTNKSDVYSFGVLLAELLTGRMALEFHRPENERNLANYFLSSMKLEYLFSIQDDTFARNKEAWSLNEQLQLQQVAEVTKRCLRVKGEKRPTMNEVVMILDGLRMSSRNSWVCGTEIDDDKLEKVHLLEGQLNSANYSDYSTVGDYDSMKNQELSSLNFGR